MLFINYFICILLLICHLRLHSSSFWEPGGPIVLLPRTPRVSRDPCLGDPSPAENHWNQLFRNWSSSSPVPPASSFTLRCWWRLMMIGFLSAISSADRHVLPTVFLWNENHWDRDVQVTSSGIPCRDHDTGAWMLLMVWTADVNFLFYFDGVCFSFAISCQVSFLCHDLWPHFLHLCLMTSSCL